jgi:hypothetical protein
MRSVKKTVPVITIAAAVFVLGIVSIAPAAANPDVHYHNAPAAANPDVHYHTAPTIRAGGSTPDVHYHDAPTVLADGSTPDVHYHA